MSAIWTGVTAAPLPLALCGAAASSARPPEAALAPDTVPSPPSLAWLIQSPRNHTLSAAAPRISSTDRRIDQCWGRPHRGPCRLHARQGSRPRPPLPAPPMDSFVLTPFAMWDVRYEIWEHSAPQSAIPHPTSHISHPDT